MKSVHHVNGLPISDTIGAFVSVNQQKNMRIG